MPGWSRWIPESLKQKIRRRFGAPDMFWCLENMRNHGFNPKFILDIGAYEGTWTSRTRDIFPDSRFLMLEAMPGKSNALEAVCQSAPEKIRYQIALLGKENRADVDFYELETASSALQEHFDTAARPVKRNMYTLENILSASDFPRVDLIKLDVQGYELEILKGGIPHLEQAEAVLMEISLIDIHQGVPLFTEVVNFMDQHGFVAYDICGLTRRPLDQALWQTDLIFVKRDSHLRQNKRWGP